MPFGVKNGSPTFQRVVSRAFRKYLDQFMKIFLDDFTVYSDMESHLMKLKLFFQKCKDYRINFNPKKCAFMVFSKLNFRVHSFQIRKNTKPQEGSSNSQYANTYKPIVDLGLQWYGSIL
jgi:hypothetical protein